MSRVLAWEGCFNVRDLGGLPTADGRRTRPRALVRSDIVCRLTPSGWNELVRHGIRTVVDLRFPDEVERDVPPHPGRENRDGIAYTNIPINSGRDPSRDAELSKVFADRDLTRAQLNLLDVDVNGVGLARACGAIARAEPGGVLVHCHAGKDRTGIVVALLLALIGVPDESIADDYAMSAANLSALTREWLDGITLDPIERARLMRQAEPSRGAILAVLDHLRSRFGGAEPYLLDGGLRIEDIVALRERLVEAG